MKDNPFASFTATSNGGKSKRKNGWMTARKVGRDDSAIRHAKSAAEDARKAK
eukprot:CAMPEP_0183727746 /NCGR_PEP_ID=MMETSP0737-20130205/26319_1 /TAXON_ID=385413 /ORGANISM="Thalassiosira miniscula, Strain CCMP1093" /LENGTH=51 /DNA_ID=CAMNT_0025959463 /DNA_START=63 /DNA_END=215 /DNA_ORIENTATION=-